MPRDTDSIVTNHVRAMELLHPLRQLTKEEFWVTLVRASCDLTDYEPLHAYKRTVEGALAAGPGNGNYVLARLSTTLTRCEVTVISDLPPEVSIELYTEFSSPEFNFEQLIRHELNCYTDA